MTRTQRPVTGSMNAVRLLMTAVLIALLSSGCIYAYYQSTLDNVIDETTPGLKEGRASAYSILWLFAWGDAGPAAAARNGGITTVNHMDMETYHILFGLYARETIIVYGD